MVVNEGYRVFVCDTVTGKITGDLPVSSLSWGERLNGAGPVQVTVPVLAEEVRNLDLRNSTAVLKQSLGVAYNGRILECGPIWEQDYDAEKESLSLTASGIWSLFDVRKALRGNAPGAALSPSGAVVQAPAASVWTLKGTLGDIARDLVAESITNNPFTRPNGSNAGALNIVLPARVGGTSNVRNYNGYDLGWIGARLKELSQVLNGPDIRFRPQFKGADPTVVEWVMETGSAAQPLLVQPGPDWTWDTAVDDSGVVRLGVKRDATGMAARVWAPGNGQERNMRLAWQTDTSLVDLGFPWTEADSASKDVEDMAILQSGADRALADSMAPWDQWTLMVRADHTPRLGDYLPGDWAAVNIGPNHPMLDPGVRRVRILAIDGDATEVVKLTVAPIQGRL